MGVVYLARQESLGRTVALKVLELGPRRDPEFVERFLREGRIAASLTHPNIVPVHDFGRDDDGSLHLTMAYMPGGSLQSLLEGRGRLDPGETVHVIEQVAAALDHAHRQGVIHRDVKASNILFDRDGNAYLSDFGIAALQGRSGLTQPGVRVGTPEYMAPELVHGQPASRVSDIYALGVTLWQCLVGQAPYRADDPQAVLFQQVNTRLPPLPPDVPEDLVGVVGKVLAKDPAARYQTAQAFRTELVAAVPPGDLHIPEDPPGSLDSHTSLTLSDDPPTKTSLEKLGSLRNRPRLGRRGRVLVAGTTALMLLIAGLAYTLYPRPAVVVGTFAYSFPPEATSAGLAVSRSWRISGSDHRQLHEELRLANSTQQPLVTDLDEVIPKEAAVSVDAVRFAPPPDQVVRRDPIVRYHLADLAPSQQVVRTYDIELTSPILSDAALQQLTSNQVAAASSYRSETASLLSPTPMPSPSDGAGAISTASPTRRPNRRSKPARHPPPRNPRQRRRRSCRGPRRFRGPTTISTAARLTSGDGSASTMGRARR